MAGMTPDQSLILIGMPAAGKSTVGRRLAARLQRPFIDTDAVMEARCGQSLQALMAERGVEGFRAAEARVLCDLQPAEPAVIATGGSVVYAARGMAALRRLGTVVFLDCPVAVLAHRVGDPVARGMVIAAGQSLAALHRERLPLYRRYADHTIACDDDPPEVVAGRVLRVLSLD
ncbi:shikimate kinase [Alkalilimnicola ehrlichii MLHE-1]|uniref:Shikimate kinase n=2 Tax=Alkalilimnicola ehrlichii TaxID=351052 RepID=Q0AA71_ALKEH|nr:shikimate kinase [Alkalilimnicola ehrlichii MLHE-1]